MLGQLTKNFHIDEFKCKDDAKTPVPNKYILNCLQLARNLQVLRDHISLPIKINSGYRTFKYNKSVGGATGSKHKIAQAGDIVVVGMGPKEVHEQVEWLIRKGRMKNGGLGLYRTFVHYDVRSSPARWDKS